MGLQSCKKSETNSSIQSSTFALKNDSGRVFQYLDPSLILAIHANLLKNGRTSDAAQVIAQYDTTTGFLKSLGKKEPIISPFKNIPIDSSKISSSKDTVPQLPLTTKASFWNVSGVFGLAWVEAHGYVGSGYPTFRGSGNGNEEINPSSLGSSNDFSYVGTTGDGLRLEGFWVNSNILSYPISYSIYARCDQNYNPNWTWYYNNPNGFSNGWSQFVGTQNHSAPTCQLQMAFANTPNFHIWYIAHMADKGWQYWTNDGNIAGIYGIELQAFAYYILQY